MSEPNQNDVAVPTPLKLRGSCESCSVSKVRCDKTKPICSRCARRKITCQYVATKRVGRKQNSTRKSSSIASPSGSKHNSVDMSQTTGAITQSPSQVLPPADMGMTLMSADMDVDLFMSNADNFDYSVFSSLTSTNTNTNSSVQTPSPQASSSTATTASLPVWDLFSDFFPIDPTLSADPHSASVHEGSLVVPGIYEDFQDLFTTPNVDDNGKADTENNAVQGTGNPSFPDHGFAGLEDPAFMDQLMSSPQNPTLQSTHVSPPRDQLDLTAQQSTSPTCGPCIIEALALMRQLFPNNPPQSCTQSDPASTSAPQPTFETITSQNETVIDACITMLKCDCSQDGYLLAVISLIVFKVLAWYAAAVHSRSEQQQHQAPSPSLISGGGDSYSDEFDATRMAAQLVLGKMHRVQHLVNQLSTKLKAKRLEGDGAVASATSTGGGGRGFTGGLEMDRLGPVGGLPVSSMMLEQLEVDLRKRLRALSLEIIGVLKRE